MLNDSRSSTLLTLPAELFHAITSHLDDVALACLALTSKGVYTAVSAEQLKQTFASLRLGWDPAFADEKHKIYPIHPDRRDFLLLWTRDHTDWYFCHRCCNLHLRSRVSPPGPLFHPSCDEGELRCLDEVGQRQSSSVENHLREATMLDVHRSSWKLDFAHVQLIMEAHRSSTMSHGLSVESLACVEKVHRPLSSKRGAQMRTALASYDAVVLPPGRLVLRIQQWCLLPHKDLYSSSIEYQIPLSHICAHHTHWRDDGWTLARVAKIPPPQQQVQHCNICEVEWLLEYKLFVGKGVASVLTKYLDLGDGKDPMGKKWRRHKDSALGRIIVPVDEEDASLRRAFEAACMVKLHKRTKENEKFISGSGSGMVRVRGGSAQGGPAASFFETWVKQADTRARPEKPLWRGSMMLGY